jgi:hypothetical protein
MVCLTLPDVAPHDTSRTLTLHIVTTYRQLVGCLGGRLDDRRVGVRFPSWEGIFYFPLQRPYLLWVREVLYLAGFTVDWRGVMGPDSEADG